MCSARSQQLPVRPRVNQLRVPNISELNFPRLRAERLSRLQAMMRHHNIPVCLFFNPANIRYATGVDMFGVYSAGIFARYCIVPAEGQPILYEFTQAMHVSSRIVADVRPAFGWAFGGLQSPEKAREWARTIRSALKELNLDGEPLAVDKLDTPGFLALQQEGIRIIDSGPATVDAREVKTRDELDIFKINGAIGSAMLSEFEAAIRPGIREFELLGVLSNTLLQYHGEYLFTRLTASGTNTNPWNNEAHDKMVEPGDLVAVDTDSNGYEGYVIDVSRTFLCGENPSPEQREAYRIAYDCVSGMFDLLKPGMTFEEFANKAPRLPDEYRSLRYSCLVHQSGLEDEGPGIPHPDALQGPRRIMPDRVIKENMVLNLECYAGKVGGPFGVKLEDQVVVTADGARLLCTYPYDSKLLA